MLFNIIHGSLASSGLVGHICKVHFDQGKDNQKGRLWTGSPGCQAASGFLPHSVP